MLEIAFALIRLDGNLVDQVAVVALDDDPRLMIISGGIADWTANGWVPYETDPLEQRGLPNGFDNSRLPEYFPVNRLPHTKLANH